MSAKIPMTSWSRRNKNRLQYRRSLKRSSKYALFSFSNKYQVANQSGRYSETLKHFSGSFESYLVILTLNSKMECLLKFAKSLVTRRHQRTSKCSQIPIMTTTIGARSNESLPERSRRIVRFNSQRDGETHERCHVRRFGQSDRCSRYSAEEGVGGVSW